MMQSRLECGAGTLHCIPVVQNHHSKNCAVEHVDDLGSIIDRKHKLASGSVLFTPGMKHAEFFGRALEPYVHHVPIGVKRMCWELVDKVGPPFAWSCSLVLSNSHDPTLVRREQPHAKSEVVGALGRSNSRACSHCQPRAASDTRNARSTRARES